jgi:FixJ family two-component response regulator
VTAAAPVIFVVDDDLSVRKSLARVMTSAGYAVEAYASAREFLARAASTGPSCLVLDVRMPGLTGLELQEALADKDHRMPIVFITGHGDISMSVKAMKAGAADFITKPFDVESLLEAVERALTKDVKDLGEEGQTAEVRERVQRLTARELEVFALVVTGMLNKQIAGELGIGEDRQGAPGAGDGEDGGGLRGGARPPRRPGRRHRAEGVTRRVDARRTRCPCRAPRCEH